MGKTNSHYYTECNQSGLVETEARARFSLLLVHARPNTPFHLSQPRHPSQRIHLDLNPQDAHSSTHWKQMLFYHYCIHAVHISRS